MHEDFITTLRDPDRRATFMAELGIEQEGTLAERPWGAYVLLTSRTKLYTAKYLILKGELSLQMHRLRSELWCLHAGEIAVYTGERKKSAEETIAGLRRTVLKPGDTIFMVKGTVHTAVCLSAEPAVIHESAFGEAIEDDNERIYDPNGRATLEGYPRELSIEELMPLVRKRLGGRAATRG